MVLIAIEYDIYDIDSIFFIKLNAKILNKESGFNVVNVYMGRIGTVYVIL